ncbi:hypothetical protein [Pseudoxanthomonas sp. PXM02]|uniref:hypothetical protein n=1 Tax=Pseudoxanthomonas sp. PXM02 TaxID=2769294 RepID=UPI00177E8FDF|nr:hypothetical protein [Pseudoxanthomonas sp. PXM02]MBD9480045.1 hypothetical protein [Pseudoxanthomonas sp. PXM02]
MTHDTYPNAVAWIRVLRPLVWAGAALLLLTPWLAMRFTDEVAWTGSDFVVFGAMLLVACVAFETITRVARVPSYLLASMIAIGAAFLLLWANLAVGIVDAPEHPANLLFLGVLVVGAVGAGLVRLHARGMSYVLAAMATAQAMAGGIAMRMDTQESSTFVLAFTGLYIVAWLSSALLFRKAAKVRVSG